MKNIRSYQKPDIQAVIYVDYSYKGIDKLTLAKRYGLSVKDITVIINRVNRFMTQPNTDKRNKKLILFVQKEVRRYLTTSGQIYIKVWLELAKSEHVVLI